MRRIKQSGLDRLNLLLNVKDLEDGLGLDRKSFEITDADLRFPCPLHAPPASEPCTVSIDRVTRYGSCRHGRCSFVQGGSLLWLYSRVLRQDIADVAEALASQKKMHLEYEFWIGDTPAAQTDSFKYVESEAKGKREMISAADVAGFVQSQAGDARVSPLRTEVHEIEQVRQRRESGNLPLLGNLYAVFRAPTLRGSRGAAEGLDLALADARFFCDQLKERYHVPEGAISFYFCAEGVHVEIDYRVFGAQPEPKLAQVYRRLAFHLAGVDEKSPPRPLPGGGSGHPARCPTLAQDAYVHDFLWQAEGSKSSSPALYKVWTSFREIQVKDGRYLRELAREARQQLDPPLRLSMERKARGLYLFGLESETGTTPLTFKLLGEDLPVRAARSARRVKNMASASTAGTSSEAGEIFAPAAVSAPVMADEKPAARAPLARKETSVMADKTTSPEGPPKESVPVAPPPGDSRPPPSESSAADLLARLTSRDFAPIPVTAFGSKTNPGTGLNHVLQGGFHVGQVVSLVGASGEGKTSFALQIASGVAFDNLQRERDSQPTVPVLYLSGQMRPEALLLKTLSRIGKVDAGEILSGKNKPKELQDAMRIYQSFHRHISVQVAAPDPDLERLRREIDQLMRQQARAVLLVIDPLTSLAGWGTAMQEESAQLCRRLTALAHELPIAVLVILSCPPAGRAGPLDYLESMVPVSEWTDVMLGIKTDPEIERAGGVLSLDERLGWKKDWKAELRRKADGAPLKRGGIDYRDMWKTEYSVLMTLKSRWQTLTHTAYYFHKALHRFEEI